MTGWEMKAERVKRGLKQFELSLLMGFGYPQLLIRIENSDDPVPEELVNKVIEIFAAFDARRKGLCK